MNNNSVIFIRLDTHKDFDNAAYCEDERLSKPIRQGRIPNTKKAQFREQILPFTLDGKMQDLNLLSSDSVIYYPGILNSSLDMAECIA